MASDPSENKGNNIEQNQAMKNLKWIVAPNGVIKINWYATYKRFFKQEHGCVSNC
jgi:hypothetical protein